MERILLWWDELDDLVGASRHVMLAAVASRLGWLSRR